MKKKKHRSLATEFKKGHKVTIKVRKKMSDSAKLRGGKKHPRWKGGKNTNENGYILVYSPDHPFKTKQNYVLEHRLVMEKHIGRILLPTEVVHHINGIVSDNRIENLMLFSSKSEHTKLHKGGRV